MTGGSTKENLEKPSLPSDWSIKKLRELCSQIQDGTHFTPQYVEYGIPFYSVESVTARNFLVSKYVTQEAHDVMARRCRPQRGDILMTRIGSLGDTAVVDWDHEASIYVSLALLRPGKAIDEAYLYAYTRSKAFATEVESRSLPNAIPKKINLGDIGDVEIWVPDSLHEQQAIAAALYDADGVVAGLERVIAKKRLIKQGAMQDLLTARRRLPGFSGEWKAATLSELADIRSGGTPSTSDATLWDGDIAWVTPTDITALDGRKFLSGTTRTISRAGLRQSSAELLPEGTIVMTSRATIGECAISAIPLTTNQGFKNFIPKDRADRDFLYYLLMSQKKGFIELCSGSTFLEIGKTQLTGYTVRVPETKKEQEAIAAVLSDMDAEIQTLESRLVKARAVKEGMMQNLLTGRVRLV